MPRSLAARTGSNCSTAHRPWRTPEQHTRESQTICHPAIPIITVNPPAPSLHPLPEDRDLNDRHPGVAPRRQKGSSAPITPRAMRPQRVPEPEELSREELHALLAVAAGV